MSTELEYDIDNRDSSTTWLWIKTKEGDAREECFGYIELTLQDMVDLIENIKENNPDMDTSEIENAIDQLKKLVY